MNIKLFDQSGGLGVALPDAKLDSGKRRNGMN